MIMLHPQPLDWEVVESHAVTPVQVLFKEDGTYLPESWDLHSDARNVLQE
jgi:hypothetical protein